MKKNLQRQILQVFAILCLQVPFLSAQNLPFEIYLEPLAIDQLGGLQSYAFGQTESKWLILGGRLDGLHRRQPWASFDLAGHNNQLWVVDPATNEVWTAPLSSLPTAIQEQLSATNMEFYQQGDYLYCLGGYGYSATQNDHITFDKLTAIQVPAVVEAIINGSSFHSYFRQITDMAFQVTGGRLRMINDTFFLLGGQKFMGRYNPIGPDHGPGFEQEYTNAIRSFKLQDDGTTISITHFSPQVDSVNLHRRDYNAEPQIFPDGTPGITMFSGVFQPDVDLPYLNAVHVSASGYVVAENFEQLYNHYHCPSIPLYDAQKNDMYTLFFGGIAQFYRQDGLLIKDDNVPFVKTVAAIVRKEDGTMQEQTLPVEMPALLGAGAEFIPLDNLPKFDNGVFDLNAFSPDSSLLLGYIYGGINSSEPNIFFINTGEESFASSGVFKVFLKKTEVVGTQDPIFDENNEIGLEVYPNPASGLLNVRFDLFEKKTITLYIYDSASRLVKEETYRDLEAGKQVVHLFLPKDSLGETIYHLVLATPEQKWTTKVLFK